MDEKSISIVRQNYEQGRIINDSYNYPYDTLPRLRSHLHPKFAIFHAGKILNRVLGKNSHLNSELQNLDPNQDLETILKLYDAWTLPVPGNARKDLTYYVDLLAEFVVDDDNVNDNCSGRPRKRSAATAEQHDKGGDPKRVRPETQREDRDNHLRLGVEAENTRAKGKATVKNRKVSKVFSDSSISNFSLSCHCLDLIGNLVKLPGQLAESASGRRLSPRREKLFHASPTSDSSVPASLKNLL